MNIVFLMRVWPSYGGGETVTKCLSAEFIRRGHTCHVLYFKRIENRGDSVNSDSRVIEYQIKTILYDEQSSEFFISKKNSNIVSQTLNQYIHKNTIDFVINQWWPVDFLKGIHKTTSAKVIKCLHMDPFTQKALANSGLKGFVFRLIEPFYRYAELHKHIYSCDKYLKYSDKFLFLAPSFANRYKEEGHLKYLHSRIDYCYNPLVYNVDKSKIELNSKENIVVVVGRLLEKHKKISRVLETWEKLQERHKSWRLQIVGDGPDKELYEQIAKELNLSRVSFEGFQNPLPYYNKAKIMLMASAYEGFPMTLLEAQQNGVVPIAMDTFSSIHDIIADGINGIITPVDISVFVNALDSLMGDNILLSKMARAGINSCDKYKISIICDKWEKIFTELKGKQ